MNKFRVIVWMTVMTTFSHVLSMNFGKQVPKVKLYPRENDHVKITELMLIEGGQGIAAEQQVLVPAQRFVKHNQKPGEHIIRSLKKTETAKEHN